MKINLTKTNVKHQKKVTPKNIENEASEKVILGDKKDPDFLLMGDKLNSMKSYGDDPFGEFVADAIVEGLEYKSHELKMRDRGKIIGAGVGLIAGTAGTFLLSSTGAGGVIGAAVIGGAGGLFLGDQIGKSVARLTWRKGGKEVVNIDTPSQPSVQSSTVKPSINNTPIDNSPKINIPNEISSLASAGLKCLDDPQSPGRGLKELLNALYLGISKSVSSISLAVLLSNMSFFFSAFFSIASIKGFDALTPIDSL